ncbi:MAG: hypothetical protein Q8R02_04420 [Hyphomonadaceae bacterium]|nr:hypothetical protein [Hyphomonadaceae bacterium]
MAKVVELKLHERPPAQELYALVISSSEHPKQGVACSDQKMGRHYFASQSEHDIEIMTRRANVWADARSIGTIYVSRLPKA